MIPRSQENTSGIVRLSGVVFWSACKPVAMLVSGAGIRPLGSPCLYFHVYMAGLRTAEGLHITKAFDPRVMAT